jgi:flagellar basal body P-ring formation protein FlgA
MRALLFVAAMASVASATPIDAAIRDQLAPLLPAGLGVAQLHIPASLPADVDAVSLELPAELRAGRPSLKVTARKRNKSFTAYVPASLSALVDVAITTHALAAGSVVAEADITIESRALDVPAAPAVAIVGATLVHELAAGMAIGSHDVVLPPPLARGTQVTVEVRHGSVHVHGTGTLELAARPGQPATVLLGFNRTALHGVLVAPSTVIVGDHP